MHRIDGPGATVDNKFTDGDPVGGVQATVVTGSWLNDVQEEIVSVLADRGITPVKGTQNQLLTAIKSLVSNLAQATEAVRGGAKIATQTQTNAGSDDATIVTPKKLATWFSTVVAQATEAVAGFAKIATQALTTAGADDATIVTPKKLQAKIAGALSGQYPMTPGAQVVFNHNLGVVPFMVEFSYVCVTAEGGWSPGDVLHRGTWYQNSASTDGSPGIFWYGETVTQVTLGLGSTVQLLPTKTTGLRFAITAANWRFTARVIG